MILPCARRSTRSNRHGFNKLTALIVLGAAAVLAGCGWSSSSFESIFPQAAQLASIAVGPPDSKVPMGMTNQFTATGVFSDGTKRDLSSQVTWISANSNIATINAAGVATALSPGATTVTAAIGLQSGSTSLAVTPATLISIGVTPMNAAIASGTTEAFRAVGVYSDNSTQDLTSAASWSSSAPTVAAVSNTSGSIGVATGVSPGSSLITATLGSVSGSMTLTVTAATLVSIDVTPPSPSIADGLTDALTATGLYTDHSTHDLTSAVTWTSSAPSIASVSNATGANGLVTAASPGFSTITATLGTVSGSTSLTVSAATLVSIGVTPANPSIASGLKSQFTAVGTYTDHSTQNLTATVVWSSSAASVAPVSNASGYDGLATALSPGSATITATLGNVAGSSTMTVTAATLVSIGVTPANPSVAAGLTSPFIATGIYTDNSTQNLTASVAWTSAVPIVASISNALGSNGLATTFAPGSTTITASSGSVSGSTGLTVTPATLVSIAVIPANPSIANGTSQQFTATGTYTDNSTSDLTSSVAWGSANLNVASISNASGSNGLACALAQGSTTITATLGSLSGSTGLNVTPATLVSIAVIPANPSIANGTVQQFAAIGTYTDTSTQPLTTSVNWSSSNSGVATISNAAGSNGLASTVAPGSSTITATLGSVSGSTGLTVTPATLVSIAVSPTAPSISDGTSLQFTATGTYTDSSTQNLTAAATWTSSDTTIASISNATGSNGVASGVGVGSTAISAAVGGVASPSVTLTVTADPEYAYAANQNSNSISEYEIGAGGALTSIGTVASGIEPNAVAIDPIGGFVYVANWSGNSISEYTVGTGGTLTATATIASGNTPASIAVDPKGRYVYTANLGDGTLSEYTIGAGGVLNSVGSVAAGSSPISVAVDPTGTYVYAANENSGDLSEYAIGAGGALSPLGTVPTGNSPQYVALDATDHYAYVANWNDNTVSEYTIGAGGALTAIGTIATGSCPETVAVDPSSRYVYVENWCEGTVSEFAIGPGGALAAIGTIATGSGPWFLTIDPSGRYVYVVNFNDSTISQYSIGTGGVLSLIGTVATGSGPNAIASGY